MQRAVRERVRLLTHIRTQGARTPSRVEPSHGAAVRWSQPCSSAKQLEAKQRADASTQPTAEPSRGARGSGGEASDAMHAASAHVHFPTPAHGASAIWRAGPSECEIRKYGAYIVLYTYVRAVSRNCSRLHYFFFRNARPSNPDANSRSRRFLAGNASRRELDIDKSAKLRNGVARQRARVIAFFSSKSKSAAERRARYRALSYVVECADRASRG